MSKKESKVEGNKYRVKKAHQGRMINFDEADRSAFINGFKKRKELRQKRGKEVNDERIKAKAAQKRSDKKKHMNAIMNSLQGMREHYSDSDNEGYHETKERESAVDMYGNDVTVTISHYEPDSTPAEDMASIIEKEANRKKMEKQEKFEMEKKKYFSKKRKQQQGSGQGGKKRGKKK